jgi:AraC-like DNA-binding protein
MQMRLTHADYHELLWERSIPTSPAPAAGWPGLVFELHHPLLTLETYGVSLPGVHLSYGTWQQHQDLRIKLENDTPYVEMHFNVSGCHSARLKGHPQPMCFSAGEHNLFYLPAFEEVVQTAGQREPARALRIKFTQPDFLALAQSEEALFGPMLKAIGTAQSCRLEPQNGKITRQMDAVIESILHCNKAGLPKRLFLEAKVLELLLLQVEGCMPVAPGPGPFSAHDRDKLHQAKYIVEGHLAAPYSLKELSRLVGLNEFKLKKGFKALFGRSVFDYLHELRMQEAKRLLLEHQKPIEEVARYCGYQYVQHFSTAFKKRYGVTPGSLRRYIRPAGN